MTQLGDAPVTITISQLDALRADVRRANERAAQLEQELAAAKTADPTDRVDALHRLVRDGCLPIVRFAVANLPPSEIPRWPRSAVVELAARLRALPDFSEDDKSLVNELAAFANEIGEYEQERSAKALRPPLLECGCAPGSHIPYRNVVNGAAERDGRICAFGWPIKP